MSYAKEIFDLIEEKALFASAIIALLIIQIDVLTGEDIEFQILFILPVALAAWSLKPYQAYGLSIALPLLRLGFVLFYWERDHFLNVLLCNSIISISALMGYAYLVTKISQQRRSLEAELEFWKKKAAGDSNPHSPDYPPLRNGE